MRELTTEEILAKCPEVIKLRPGERALEQVRLGRPRSGGGSRKSKWWNETDRIKAAVCYALTGNAKRVEEITRIPSGTIRQWKTQPWWPQVIDRIRQEHDDELDVKFTGIIDKTIGVINDRLEKGDFIYDTKNEQLVRKPVGARETAFIASTFIDKRALLRENKKVHSEESAVMDRLKKLAREFEGFVKAKDVTAESSYDRDVTKESLEDIDASERDTDEKSDSELSPEKEVTSA